MREKKRKKRSEEENDERLETTDNIADMSEKELRANLRTADRDLRRVKIIEMLKDKGEATYQVLNILSSINDSLIQISSTLREEEDSDEEEEED